MARAIDPASAIGKAPSPEAHYAVVVVGAGPAGLAAAQTAARLGLETMLIDENPVDDGLIALDVPLHFGQRSAGFSSRNRAVEQILETNSGLAEAFELGIEIALGVSAWGVYLNGETVHSIDKPLLGLADGERSWMISFDRLIIAAGARDLGVAFDGWQLPGVMGAQAAHRLIREYGTFNGRRMLILGSGELGLKTSELALAAGIEVAGIIEARPGAIGTMGASLSKVPLHAGYAIVKAHGAAEVERATIAPVGEDGQPVAGQALDIACDTIVLAIGAVPNIELAAAAGCRTQFVPELGGHVPVIDAHGATSIRQIYVAGDCVGTHDGKCLDSSVAEREGVNAALAAARSLGAEAPPLADAGALRPAADQYAYWRHWITVLAEAGSDDTVVCQCEEVTRAELLDLSPPRYLAWESTANSRRDLCTLADGGAINQDQVKRLTRAGMGPCQGRRCREQVQILLAQATNVSPADIALASYRPPVRPLPLDVFAASEESDAMRDNWVAWFNIASQWTPHWLPADMPEDGVVKKIVSGK